MTTYGYARVSSVEQTNNYSLEIQQEKLIQHGVPAENVYPETGSATVFQRPILEKVLGKLEPGDTLVWHRLIALHALYRMQWIPSGTWKKETLDSCA